MESKNLCIRETVFSDCEYFARYENDPDLTEFFTMEEGRSYEDIVTEFINDSSDKTKLQFTITTRNEKKAIGRILITNLNDKYDSLDITRIYIAEKKFRGMGLGEEALRLILDYAFITLHRERVTLDHFINNKIAAALYNKVGFKNEGVMRNAGKKNGKYLDLQLMSMLRAEYYSNVHE